MSIPKDWQKALGPGLLYAGAAIGVSHIVQSTRAGAMYGLALVGFVVLVNLLKYPFFEFASRYTSAKQQSVLAGYQQLNRTILPAFILITLLVMFPILGAISSVFAGIVIELTASRLPATYLHGMALSICTLLLVFGQFNGLNRIIKWVVVLLTITTLIAAFAAFSRMELVVIAAQGSFDFEWSSWLFLIAFAGWMPTPVDSSVWQSLWTLEKYKTNTRLSWSSVAFDFRIGYILSALLAVVFVFLGAVVVYATNQTLPDAAAAFVTAFIQLYVDLLGAWAYPVVAISILATLLSTLLTVMDGYPRVLEEAMQRQWPVLSKRTLFKPLVIFYALGTWLLLLAYSKSMLQLIDLATSLSFLLAPIFAWWNYRLVIAHDFPQTLQPEKGLKLLAQLGIVFLLLFSFVYLYSLFIPSLK